MPDDLYQIGLQPGEGSSGGAGNAFGSLRSGGADAAVPNPEAPNGSIGGSDVGLNPRDDQRVRDLMQQYLQDIGLTQNVNNLVANPVSSSDVVGGWFQSNWIVAADGTASNIGDYTTPDHTITHPGGPLIIDYSGLFKFDYGGSPVIARWGVDINIDGNLIMEQFWERQNSATQYFIQPFNFSFLLDGTIDIGGGLGITTTTQLAAMAAGSHTYTVKYWWVLSAAAAGTVELQVSQECVVVRSIASGVMERVEYP